MSLRLSAHKRGVCLVMESYSTDLWLFWDGLFSLMVSFLPPFTVYRGMLWDFRLPSGLFGIFSRVWVQRFGV